MITRFRHSGLKTLFRAEETDVFDARLAPKLRRMVAKLHHGPLPDAMMLPAYRLHASNGAGEGRWSAWVSGNIHLTFDIDGQNVTNVDLQGDV